MLNSVTGPADTERVRPLTLLRTPAFAAVSLLILLACATWALRAEGASTWQTATPVDGTARAEVTFVQLDGRFYLAGGNDSAHQVYDPATDAWSPVASLPGDPRNHVQAVAVGRRIFYIGGLTGFPGPSVGRIDIYDPATDSFSSGAAMTGGRERGAGVAVAYGTKIYVVGGLSGGTARPWVDVYDTETDTWTAKPDMPTARDHLAAAIVDGKLYAIGGRDTDPTDPADLRGQTEILDLTTDTWSAGAPLPTPRGGMASAVIGDQIYVIGGEGNGQAYSAADVYDTSANSWSAGPSMQTPRHGTMAAKCNGAIHVAGGGTDQGSGNETSTHEVLFPGGAATTCGSRYRVNAGGPALAAPHGWTADTFAGPSPYVNAVPSDPDKGVASTGATIDMTHPSIPDGTPAAMLANERFDRPGGTEMSWDFPVVPGAYEVRVYFAETFAETQAEHARVFDMDIEGDEVLDHYDVFADVGGDKAVAQTFTVTSDENLDIDFRHIAQNPHPRGIEIRPLDDRPGELEPSPSERRFGSVLVGQTRTYPVTLTNRGGFGDPEIDVSAVAVTGTDASMFTATLAGGPATLEPGESTTVNVTFSPTATGARSAQLNVANDGAGGPLVIDLKGTASTTIPVGFGRSQLDGIGFALPTSLQFGPDGRLYVAEIDGTIKAHTVIKDGPGDYRVDPAASETIGLVKDIPNHNDDGSLNASVTDRLVTGITVAGTAVAPEIYVVSSDPRIGGGESGDTTNLDTNSGVLSRLTKSGGTWTRQDLVHGLPRSEENHASNGLQFGPDGDLYIAQGGNTNKGAPSHNFAQLPEYALSAAILKVDLDALGTLPYKLPTLDGTTEPWGGRDGVNQATADGPVSVYAPGFRNPYDLVFTDAGSLFAIDNGGNAGWGDKPVGSGTADCLNTTVDGGGSDDDSLHLIPGAGYYGGHPNPARGNPSGNTFGGRPAVAVANPVECNYVEPAVGALGIKAVFPSSTNGIVEYTDDGFGGDLQGDLITAGYAFNELYRIDVAANGTDVTSAQPLARNVGVNPLDVTVGPDGDPSLDGTIFVGDLGSFSITVLEPNTIACGGTDDATIDEDGDQFSNADELDNQTNACSAADQPGDWDGDHTSDRNDRDDDNDTVKDVSDPFSIDADNGRATALPVAIEFDNGVNDGGFLNAGFTGLMSDGKTDPRAMFAEQGITSRGAAGVFTVDEVPAGTATGSANTQRYAFQLGVDVTASSAPFAACTRALAPFAGTTPPKPGWEQGLMLGTGTQDDYVRVDVVATAGNTWAVRFIKEVGGAVVTTRTLPLTSTQPDAVDLGLEVNPAAGTVQPTYAISPAAPGACRRTPLGDPVTIPAAWLNGASAPAVGFISSSGAADDEFAATWDFLRVAPYTPPGSDGTGGGGTGTGGGTSTGGGGGGDTTPPAEIPPTVQLPEPPAPIKRVSALRPSTRTLRLSRKNAKIAVRYTVQRALQVTFTLERCARYRPARSGGKRSCRSYRRVLRSTRAARRGANTFTITRRMGGKTLRTGDYRLSAAPAGVKGAVPQRVLLRVVR